MLLLFFVLPMAIMVQLSLLPDPPASMGGHLTFQHYLNILTDPIYARIALNTTFIATAS